MNNNIFLLCFIKVRAGENLNTYYVCYLYSADTCSWRAIFTVSSFLIYFIIFFFELWLHTFVKVSRLWCLERSMPFMDVFLRNKIL